MFGFFKNRSKYGNTKVEWNGMKFDSKKELKRWLVLLDEEKAGNICCLDRQVRFELVPAVTEEYEEQLKTKTVTKTRVLQRAMTYTADFVYEKDGKLVVEDVKGSSARAKADKGYTDRKKLMFALKGIKIKEVYKPTDEV